MATAYKFQRQNPDARVRIYKESAVAQHQSTHNSGVLHAGLHYKPGSLKAKLAVDGIRQMVTFCQRFRVDHEICGKWWSPSWRGRNPAVEGTPSSGARRTG